MSDNTFAVELVRDLPSILAGVAAVIAALQSWKNGRQIATVADKADVAAVKADTAAVMAEQSATVAKATHALVDGAMSVPLKLAMLMSQQLADMQPDNAHVAEAAKLAREAYDNHLKALAVVDRQPGTDAEKSGKV